MQIGKSFPFAIEGMAPKGAAAGSGLVLTGDKLIAVDGRELRKEEIGTVRNMMAGREGSKAVLGLLRKEGVKPDINVLKP